MQRDGYEEQHGGPAQDHQHHDDMGQTERRSTISKCGCRDTRDGK